MWRGGVQVGPKSFAISFGEWQFVVVEKKVRTEFVKKVGILWKCWMMYLLHFVAYYSKWFSLDDDSRLSQIQEHERWFNAVPAVAIYITWLSSVGTCAFFLESLLSKVNQLRRMNQAQVKILQISLSQSILWFHSLQLHIKYYMDVSENSGTPKSSILGYHYFWKHPYTRNTFGRI